MNELHEKYLIPFEWQYGLNVMIIPERMMAGIGRYVQFGTQPGHFLTALIKNDLRETINRADDSNILILPAYIGYFYNETDPRCWGSPAKMHAWMKSFKERG